MPKLAQGEVRRMMVQGAVACLIVSAAPSSGLGDCSAGWHIPTLQICFLLAVDLCVAVRVERGYSVSLAGGHDPLPDP